MDRLSVERGLRRICSLLESHADSRGYFPAVRIRDGVPCEDSPTVFVTSLALCLLEAARDFADRRSAERAAAWVAAEAGAARTWNYWKRGSRDSASRPYPDDLDDTFMSLLAIDIWIRHRRAGRRYGDRRDIDPLLADPDPQTGLHWTWIGTRLDEKTPDPIVNATIVRYLDRRGMASASLKKSIHMQTRKRISSGYYCSPLYMRYALARAGIVVGTVGSDVEVGPYNACQPALAASLSMLSGSTDRARMEQLIGSIVHDPHPERPYPIYREQSSGGSDTLIGSPAISLAACAEALALWLERYG